MTPFDASTLIALRRVQAAVPSPDGAWLAVVVQRLDDEKLSKYVGDLWRVPLSGGQPIQLTRGEWNDHSPAFLCDGTLLFLSNRPTGSPKDDDHKKRSQVFAFSPFGGDPSCLTQEPLGVKELQTSVETQTFFVTTSLLPETAYDEQRETLKERTENGPSALVYDDMPVRFWDHWLPSQVPHLIAYVDGERRDLTPDAGREMLRSAWTTSPDGSFVVLHPSQKADDRITEQPSILIDVATGTARPLADQPRTWFSSPVVSSDSARIAMAKHTRSDGVFGVSEVIIIDAESGERTTLPRLLDTGFEPCGWTADSIIATGPLRTHRPVFLIDAKTGVVTRITAESVGGTHLNVKYTGDGVVGVRSSITQPPEVFYCSLTPETPPRLLTSLSGFDGAAFASVEDLSVTSTDGAQIQYRVVRPADSDAASPCMMAIHGGPISHWGDVWHWRWNSLVWAAAGYVVALPNPRGSVGFGQAFIEGIWQNTWGGQCYEDLMSVTDALAARDDVDASRMVALGGSFGGYMTNWIGTQTDRFCCLITHASLFDIRAFHGVTDSPAWWSFSFGVHPYKDRAAFDRYSPLEHIEDWRSPTLVIHGDKDYRVPVGESLSLFEALRFHGVEARLLVFPDENHWILRPKNVERWFSEVITFVEKYTT